MSTVRKAHQVFVILIPTRSEQGVKLLQIESVHNFLLQILGHTAVINHPDRLSMLSRVYTDRDFLYGRIIGIILQIHLSILGKLKGVSLELAFRETDENQRKRESDDIIKIHNVIHAVRRGHLDKPSIYSVRHFDDGIFCLAIGNSLELDGQIDTVVFQGVDVFYFRHPYRVGRAIELVVIKIFKPLLLLVVEHRVVYQAYLVLGQSFEHFVGCLVVFLTEFSIKLVDCLNVFLQFLPLRLCQPVVLNKSCKRGNPHAEEFIQIV